jgi:hypothetical protein
MIFLTRVTPSTGNLLCGDSCFTAFPSLQDILLSRFLYPQSFFLARVSASRGYPQQGSLRNLFLPLQDFPLTKIFSTAKFPFQGLLLGLFYASPRVFFSAEFLIR